MAVAVHTDVETFSRVNLPAAGTWRYWEDDSTEILCLSYSIGKSGPVRSWLPGTKPPQELLQLIQSGARMYAHNAHFERQAYKHLSRKYGWPKVRDKQWHCTAAQAAALALPRALERACNAVDLPQRKDTDGKRLLRMFAQPQPKTGARILPADRPDEFKLLRAYCDQDVRAEQSLTHTIPVLPDAMEEMYQMDLRLNERGLPFDVQLITAMKEVSHELTNDIVARTRELTGGINPGQVAKLLEWAENEGVALTDMKAMGLRNAILKRDLPDNVKEMIELRLEAARVSVKKLDSALKCMNSDHRGRGLILFHGATTGRWSGKLVQPHNFPRGELSPRMIKIVIDLVLKRDIGALRMLFENPMMALSSIMRSIICAPNGKLLNISDYKAIEARILAWIADQSDVLALYFAGADLYIYMASKIYKIPPEKVSKDQRKFGKDTVLGCGYQMGVDKFILTGLNRNIVIPRELAEACVYGYRNSMKMIVKLWSKVENAAIAAVTTGKPQHVAKCIFHVQGRYLFCRLPSGRQIAYPEPEIHIDKARNQPKLTFMTEVKKRWVRQNTYGGKLVENIVQGIAWDVMAQGMRNAEDDGFPLVGTVHDEGIAEQLASDADNEAFGAALCRLPEWAHGCPIETEGFAEQRYRKG